LLKLKVVISFPLPTVSRKQNEKIIFGVLLTGTRSTNTAGAIAGLIRIAPARFTGPSLFAIIIITIIVIFAVICHGFFLLFTSFIASTTTTPENEFPEK
jgi:hypothetical protein